MIKKNKKQLELSILTDVKAVASCLNKTINRGSSSSSNLSSTNPYFDDNTKASCDDIKIYNSISDAYFRESKISKK